MAPHSSTLAWKIPQMEEPGRWQSMGSQRVGHNWATSLSLFSFMHWRRTWQPLQCSCLENPRDGGAWWAAVYGVSQSWTRLKRLSISISINSSTSNIAFSETNGLGSFPLLYTKKWASLKAQTVKNLPAMWETWVQYLGWEDPLQEGRATHSSILVWSIPWTEEPG